MARETSPIVLSKQQNAVTGQQLATRGLGHATRTNLTSKQGLSVFYQELDSFLESRRN
jgi:hypothetical protein